ncbi:hypothetical protein Tco_0928822, partial [Tanacetum coccineum]
DEGCTVCIIDEEKIKHVGLPEVIDKEITSENVKEEINLHQKVTGHYKMKAIKSDLEAELPIVPTRIVSDFVQEFMGVKKPDKVIHVDVGSERVLRAVSWRGGSDHVEGGLQGGASGSVSI